MKNYELNECLRKSRKLIRMTERNSGIPSSSFSGRTADALKMQRKIQMNRLAIIYKKIESLKW